MAEILSFQDAQRRHAHTVQHVAGQHIAGQHAAGDAATAERAEALSYVERMAAFHAEMQRLTARFDILGDAADDGRADAEIVWHPAMLRA